MNGAIDGVVHSMNRRRFKGTSCVNKKLFQAVQKRLSIGKGTLPVPDHGDGHETHPCPHSSNESTLLELQNNAIDYAREECRSPSSLSNEIMSLTLQRHELDNVMAMASSDSELKMALAESLAGVQAAVHAQIWLTRLESIVQAQGEVRVRDLGLGNLG